MSKPESRAQTETPLEPDLPICDPHHHLWERAPRVYLLKDLRADLASGHTTTWCRRWRSNAVTAIVRTGPS